MDEGSHVFSVQGTAGWAGLDGARSTAGTLGDALEHDLRALYGAGFQFAEMDAFLEGEVGYRFRSQAADEVRADLTFGVRPLPRWLVMAQSFNIVAREPAEGASASMRSY